MGIFLCISHEKPNDEGYVEDDERIEMMQGYIDYMLKAMEDGCNVRGYYAWSTMDLYSWVNGYEKRYGLVRVDFDDHNRRYPKKSYYWYKDVIETDGKHVCFEFYMNTVILVLKKNM